MTTRPPPAYVLWFGPTGLSVARALGREGIPVVGLHHDVNEPCAGTRYARVEILPPLSSGDGPWLEYLLAHGRDLAPVKAVLIPGSDASWMFAWRHRAALAPYFHVSMPQHGLADEWVGKPYQYAAAERVGIPFPRTFTIASAADLERAAGEATLPCLVKPVLSHLWQREYGTKLAFARDVDELMRHGRDAMARGLDIMVQEYIPAADDEIYCYYSYRSAEGATLGHCVIRKLRQNEPRFGNSSMSQCIDQPRVVEQSLRLMDALDYQGIGAIEFKRDPRDDQFKLMELNVRPTLLMGLAADSGVNLPLLAYRDLLGEKPPARTVTPRRYGRRVGIFMNDLRSARFYHQVDGLSYAKWLWSWIGARDIYFAWDDWGPFRGYIHMFIDHLRRGRLRGFPLSFPTPEQWAQGKWDGQVHPTVTTAPDIRRTGKARTPFGHAA